MPCNQLLNPLFLKIFMNHVLKLIGLCKVKTSCYIESTYSQKLNCCKLPLLPTVHFKTWACLSKKCTLSWVICPQNLGMSFQKMHPKVSSKQVKLKLKIWISLKGEIKNNKRGAHTKLYLYLYLHFLFLQSEWSSKYVFF